MSPRKAHNTTAQVRDGRLYLEAFPEGISLESDEWWAFLETGTTFYYNSLTSGMTVRADQRFHQLFWYAFKRHNKKLRKLYVGKTPQVTQVRLEAVAAALIQVTQDIPQKDDAITAEPVQVTQAVVPVPVEQPTQPTPQNTSKTLQVTQAPLTLNRATLPVPVNELLAVCTAYHQQKHGTDWKWAGGKIAYSTTWKGGVEGYFLEHPTEFGFHYLGKDRAALVSS